MSRLYESELWFIFGSSPDGSVVDIANVSGDVVNSVPRELAGQIIAAHNRSLEKAALRVVGDYEPLSLEPNE